VASDDKFILTGWNAAAESTYGRRAEEVLGRPDALVFRTDFVGVERAEAIKRLLDTGRFHGELTHRRADGRRIHIESRAAALFDSSGKRLGYVSVNRDITERRYAEETIRALLNDVLTAQEEERRRIARELHDDTAQTLTSLLVGLRAVEESKDLDHALGAASTLRGFVSAALLGVQRMARGLRPSVLDDLGLEEALERLALDVSRAQGFLVDLHSTGPRLPRLPEGLEIALYRMAQEALTNATKHASPKAVSILIHRTATEVRLVVEDDGKGFDASEILSEAQLGLVGMRERAHLVGGSMTLESAPGSGTTICISVPIPAPKPSSS
jgi:PAS domain S-box-containing protein